MRSADLPLGKVVFAGHGMSRVPHSTNASYAERSPDSYHPALRVRRQSSGNCAVDIGDFVVVSFVVKLT